MVSSRFNLIDLSDLSDPSELIPCLCPIRPALRFAQDFGTDSAKELPADPTPQIEITPRELKQPASSD